MKYYRRWLRDLTISSVKLQEVLFVGTRTVPLVRSGRYIQYKLWVETDIHRELLKVIHDQGWYSCGRHSFGQPTCASQAEYTKLRVGRLLPSRVLPRQFTN